ncbi:carboxymuconolactone decarboxylase domain-containing protein [Proteiniborus sp. DW1]|uniref:carboxymuconolactone decarboxylase family protein n=1 Tax=Proteiniborus sp. DW1 TaxID=1889883 RepID=UPI00092DF79F|nr:carboxymuconolactone decarboxylase family protein [Proteiniborus sp. DW1]SCG83053.1 carboxymuconolactone decarboxylase domain-containing protein [Proteiniborus sp. DW1]
MDRIEKNLKYFLDKYGDIYEAYENYGQKVHNDGGPLDEKTRWLIKVAISAACKHHYSVRTHIRKALKSGCTRDEIEHALMLVAPTAGFPAFMEALMCLREELDENGL